MARFARLALVVTLYAAVLIATDLVGSALHSHKADAAVPVGDCPLVTTVRTDGRAIVTYDDATNNPRMSAAIRGAVAQWNADLSDVRIVPDANFAALTFSGGSRNNAIPICSSSAARTVRIELSTPLWSQTTGQTVDDPVASIAKDVGRALGLHGGGRCPDLMSSVVCANRDQSPSAAERALVDRLYAPAH